MRFSLEKLFPRNKVIEAFRFDSLFIQLLLLFVALLVAVILVLSGFAQHFFQTNYLERSLQSGYVSAEAVRAQLEYSTEKIEGLCQEFFANTTVNQVLAEGGLKQSSASLNAAIQLHALTEGNPHVDYGELWLRRGATVLSSEQEYNPLVKSSLRELFAAYQSSGNQLIIWGDQLYLLYDYPQSRPLATLVLRIKEQALYDDCFAAVSMQKSASVLVYTTDGQPLFPRQCAYPEHTEFRLRRLEVQEGLTVWQSQTKVNDYFTISPSSKTDCLVLSLTDFSQVMPGYFSFMGELTPYLLLMLLVTAAIFLLLVRKFYAPLREMVLPIMQQEDAALLDSSKNELDYLGLALDRNVQQNQYLSQLLSTASQSVLERTLLRLLNEPSGDRQEVRNMLDCLDEPFLRGGVYGVGVLQLEYPENAAADDLSCELSLLRLDRAARDFWAERCPLLVLNSAPQRLALLLHWPERADQQQAEAEFRECCAYLRREGRDERYRLLLGFGGLCREVADLPEIYNEARMDMGRRKYYAEGGEENENNPVAYYERRISRVFDAFLSGSEEADSELEQIKGEILSTPSPDRCGFFRTIIDMINENLLRLQIASEPFSYEELSWPEGDEEKALTAYCALCLEQTGQVLANAGKISQYGYIDAAKKVIARQYNDSLLSLESVAQELGISGHYLSRLFHRYSPPGFTEHLRRYRIDQAARMLRQSKFSVAEIGYKTGFASPQNFNVVFKKYLGMPPGQYRRSGSGDKEEE